MTKPQFKALWVAAAALAAGLALDLFLASRCSLAALRVLSGFLLVSLLVVLAAYVRQRLAWLAAQEQQDAALAEKENPATLFNKEEDESEPFSIARSRQQFERFVVPSIAPVLGMLQLYLAWRGWQKTGAPAGLPELLPLPAAFLSGQAFVCFLLSRYLLGIAREPGHQRMKGPGIYLGLTALVSLLTAADAILVKTGVPRADWAVSWTFILLLGVLGIENYIRAVAYLYSPRIAAAPAPCVSYESRLGALLTDPASWVNNVAQALDYQFGFNISHTWFYRFLENALAPLIFFQLAALYLLSSFVFLGPEEEAILEKFGRPVPAEEGGLLDSGFHLKWPWPFETVRRFPSKRVQTLDIGNVSREGPSSMLWTVQHHTGQETFLTASRAATAGGKDDAQTVPVNLLSMHIPVEYRITNIYQYAFSASEPLRLLEQSAYAGLTRITVSHGMEEIISSGQIHLTQELKTIMQQRADAFGLGIRIEFVGLRAVHPPVAVADAFESVVGALEERESAKLQASAYAAKVLPLAAADAEAAGEIAKAYRVRRKALAEAEAYQFDQRQKGYKMSPEVFKKDLYLRTLSGALSGARKYIVSADPGNQVIQFDFKEKLKPELYNFGPDITEELP